MSDTSVLELLRIADLANQWPNLKPLHDLAMDDLVEANEGAKKELVKRTEAKAKAKAEADAKAAAERQKLLDEAAAQEKKAQVSAPAPTVPPAVERRE